MDTFWFFCQLPFFAAGLIVALAGVGAVLRRPELHQDRDRPGFAPIVPYVPSYCTIRLGGDSEEKVDDKKARRPNTE